MPHWWTWLVMLPLTITLAWPKVWRWMAAVLGFRNSGDQPSHQQSRPAAASGEWCQTWILPPSPSVCVCCVERSDVWRDCDRDGYLYNEQVVGVALAQRVVYCYPRLMEWRSTIYYMLCDTPAASQTFHIKTTEMCRFDTAHCIHTHVCMYIYIEVCVSTYMFEKYCLCIL